MLIGDVYCWIAWAIGRRKQDAPIGLTYHRERFEQTGVFVPRRLVHLPSLRIRGKGGKPDAMPPEQWLVEVSGIPYGLMGEMLQGGGNKWLGMVYGMTTRFGWSYQGPKWDLETLRIVAGQLNHGTDHLWLIGAFQLWMFIDALRLKGERLLTLLESPGIHVALAIGALGMARQKATTPAMPDRASANATAARMDASGIQYAKAGCGRPRGASK